VKIGDLVTMRDLSWTPKQPPVGVIVETPESSRDDRASQFPKLKVSWNFLDGKVGENFRHDLKLLTE